MSSGDLSSFAFEATQFFQDLSVLYAVMSISCPQWLITRLVSVRQHILYCTVGALQIELAFKLDWIKTTKTKGRLIVQYSGHFCAGGQKGSFPSSPRLDVTILSQEPAMNEYIISCGPEVCSVWYTLSRMTHSLSRQLEQVAQSELEQESEQKRSRGRCPSRDGDLLLQLPAPRTGDWLGRERDRAGCWAGEA